MVQAWYFAKKGTLKSGSFPDFMATFWKRFLRRNWVDLTKGKMLRSYQGEDDLFNSWVKSLENTNALLVGTTAAFSKPQMREHIESHSVADLRAKAETAEVKALIDFQEFREVL